MPRPKKSSEDPQRDSGSKRVSANSHAGKFIRDPTGCTSGLRVERPPNKRMPCENHQRRAQGEAKQEENKRWDEEPCPMSGQNCASQERLKEESPGAVFAWPKRLAGDCGLTVHSTVPESEEMNSCENPDQEATKMSKQPGRRLRLNFLLHVPFEGPEAISDWVAERGHELKLTKTYEGDPMPSPTDFDLLVVMGGPMSVHDEAAHLWLRPEKELVAGCLAAGRYVLGICLGSQILAECLGSRVRRNEWKEIGWLPVETFPEEDSVLAGLPAELTVFHWHGETYDLPPGSVLRARSEGCEVQAFELPHAVGLQFHLEVTGGGVENLISCCGEEVGIGPYEQPADTMREGERVHGDQARRNLFLLLDRIAQRVECRCLHLGNFGG